MTLPGRDRRNTLLQFPTHTRIAVKSGRSSSQDGCCCRTRTLRAAHCEKPGSSLIVSLPLRRWRTRPARDTDRGRERAVVLRAAAPCDPPQLATPGCPRGSRSLIGLAYRNRFKNRRRSRSYQRQPTEVSRVPGPRQPRPGPLRRNLARSGSAPDGTEQSAGDARNPSQTMDLESGGQGRNEPWTRGFSVPCRWMEL